MEKAKLMPMPIGKLEWVSSDPVDIYNYDDIINYYQPMYLCKKEKDFEDLILEFFGNNLNKTSVSVFKYIKNVRGYSAFELCLVSRENLTFTEQRQKCFFVDGFNDEGLNK